MEKTKNKIEKEIIGNKEKEFVSKLEVSNHHDEILTKKNLEEDIDIKNIPEAMGDLPEEAEAEVAEKVKELKAIKAEALRKIEDLEEGSDGGWYEHVETGERYYVKTFDADDHARIYYIDNKIYSKLGLPVADMELVDFGDKIGVAEKEIDGKTAVTDPQTIAVAEEYRTGYVADAFMNNSVAMGGQAEGYVVDSSGKLIRVGFESAHWDDYWHEDYLDSNPSEICYNLNFIEGKTGLSHEDIKKQILQFKEAITEDFLKTLFEETGAENDWTETLLERVKNLDGQSDLIDERIEEKEAELRREREKQEELRLMLEKAIDLSDVEGVETANSGTIQEIVSRFEEMKEKPSKSPFCPKSSFVADKSHIESQEIDVLGDHKAGVFRVRFKLTAPDFAKLMGSMPKLLEDKPGVTEGEIIYGEESSDTFKIKANEFFYKYKGEQVKVLISSGQQYRAALGLVQIEIPQKIGEEELKPTDIEKILSAVSNDLLGIESATEIPDEKSEEAYIKARFLWHHKLDPKKGEAEYKKVKDRLRREVVFPEIEYSTVIEAGRHRELESRFGHYIVYHQVHQYQNLPDILRAGGLISTHERYSRGGMISGMSSLSDMETGGADSVFTRIVSRAACEKSKMMDYSFTDGAALVFDNELLDRTDWYTYIDDQYGKTTEAAFAERKAPEELFTEFEEDGFRSRNEQMFRTGIPTEMFRAIAVSSDYMRDNVIGVLSSAGIEQINGIPIEDFVVIAYHYEEAFEAFPAIENDEPNIPNGLLDRAKRGYGKVKKRIKSTVNGLKGNIFDD